MPLLSRFANPDAENIVNISSKVRVRVRVRVSVRVRVRVRVRLGKLCLTKNLN